MEERQRKAKKEDHRQSNATNVNKSPELIDSVKICGEAILPTPVDRAHNNNV